jgi:signal transduction histidine kinase
VRLGQRLFLGALAIVSAVVLFLVAIANPRLERQLYEDKTHELLREARLVDAGWLEPDAADSVADAAGLALGRRVTLIDSSGRVTGDSEFGAEAIARLGNHSSRPEIVAARAAGSGSARRRSESAGDEELYAAVRSRHGFVRVALHTRDLERVVDRMQSDVLLAGLIALILTMGLAWFFTQSVARPVRELSDVARALAAGDLTRRPALAAPGEVGDLASALGGMADQLALRMRSLQAEEALMSALIESLQEGVVAVDARRQVVRINRSGRELLGIRAAVPFPVEHLPRDRGLREALEDALNGAASGPDELRINARLFALTARPLPAGGAVLAIFDLTQRRQLETVRTDFVANVSHELKTPLTVIRGFADTLAHDDSLPPATRRDFARTVQSNAERMQRIVDDLLDLSRIESGGWMPNPEPIDFLVAAREAAASAADVAVAKGVRIDVVPGDGAATLRADLTALGQILANLIENAVRYTPSGGSVTVESRREADGVRVSVRDTGIGIAAEHLPRIFERFYRVDPARSRDAGGTGLGLAIVRHLVEAHGGRANASSTPGRGTVVSVFFPAREDQATGK